MAFVALELSLDVARQLAAPLRVLAREDSDLARQVRRAVSSVALNLGEGNRREGADRRRMFRIAAGSAAEAHTALKIAVEWSYLDQTAVSTPVHTLDRISSPSSGP